MAKTPYEDSNVGQPFPIQQSISHSELWEAVYDLQKTANKLARRLDDLEWKMQVVSQGCISLIDKHLKDCHPLA